MKLLFTWAEVELGQLVSERATKPEIRQFGQLAQQKGITIPPELDAKHKAIKNRLARLSGDAFDQAYVREMLIDHRKDVSEFRAKARSAADPDRKGVGVEPYRPSRNI
jgi:putative membrane protein